MVLEGLILTTVDSVPWSQGVDKISTVDHQEFGPNVVSMYFVPCVCTVYLVLGNVYSLWIWSTRSSVLIYYQDVSNSQQRIGEFFWIWSKGSRLDLCLNVLTGYGPGGRRGEEVVCQSQGL